MLRESTRLRDEGFTAIQAEKFLAHPECVRDCPGVYLILLNGTNTMPYNLNVLPLWMHQGHYHAYTGESIGVRSRVLLHLTGTIRDSTFRESLLAIQFSKSALWPESIADLSTLESRLSNWLAAHAMVAFRACSYVRDAERDILMRSPSPFNIVSRQVDEFGKLLKADRRKFREHLKATGQRYICGNKPRSAWLTEGSSNHRAGLPSQPTKPLAR